MINDGFYVEDAVNDEVKDDTKQMTNRWCAMIIIMISTNTSITKIKS